MGEYSLKNSTAEKYLGDQFNKKIISASITETLDKKKIGLDEKIKKIMAVTEDPSLKGMNSANSN